MQANILVFGGGPLQLSIIQRAKHLGFTTIVIDPDSDAPGRQIADVFFSVAGNDFETTLQIAIEKHVKGIVTAATDKPILMMCRIAEQLDLPFPSYESCETLLDKAKFKTFLQNHNLLYASGDEYQGDDALPKFDLKYPVIVKPVMNSGSRGVIKCERPEYLRSAITETLTHCKDLRFLIEEFIEGDEISVEALVQNNKVHLLQITDKILTPPPYNVELGHIQPSKFHYLKGDISDLIQTVVDKTGLNNCALHPELKINDDKITIIEIGPRLGGDFITSHLVPLSTGIFIEDQLIRISTGLPIEFDLQTKASMVTYLNFPKGLKVVRNVSENELKKIFPEIESFHFDLNIGQETRQITNSLNRYGQFLISGANTSDFITTKEGIYNYLEQQIFH